MKGREKREKCLRFFFTLFLGFPHCFLRQYLSCMLNRSERNDTTNTILNNSVIKILENTNIIYKKRQVLANDFYRGKKHEYFILSSQH